MTEVTVEPTNTREVYALIALVIVLVIGKVFAVHYGYEVDLSELLIMVSGPLALILQRLGIDWKQISGAVIELADAVDDIIDGDDTQKNEVTPIEASH